MKLVLISDTHGFHNQIQLPEGDILIHAGDFTMSGKEHQVLDFNNWLGTIKDRFKHILVIAGNHDFYCENHSIEENKKILSNCTYLQDEEIIIDRLKFYGSPWQPEFFNWAFNLQRGEEIQEKWNKIPTNTDILITHGPVYDIVDKTERGSHVGCQDLLNTILYRIEPKIYICGHIHEAYGKFTLSRKKQFKEDIIFVNASICTLDYRPTNLPITIDI